MTCIIGVETNDGVILASDSGLTGDSITFVLAENEKTFLNENIAFGGAGSMRILQLIRYSLVVPERANSQSDLEYLSTDFVESIIDVLKEKGSISVLDETGVDCMSQTCFLLGYNKRLYLLDQDFQVSRVALPAMAIGTGADIALGALMSLMKFVPDMSHSEKLMKTLEIVASVVPSVKAPFYTIIV